MYAHICIVISSRMHYCTATVHFKLKCILIQFQQRVYRFHKTDFYLSGIRIENFDGVYAHNAFLLRVLRDVLLSYFPEIVNVIFFVF